MVIIGREKFFILNITETWLAPVIDNDFLAIEGYNFFRVDRGSREDGVGLYAQSHLKDTFGAGKHDNGILESICASFQMSNISMNVIVIYRPPDYQKLDVSFSMFENLIFDNYLT